MWYLRSTEPADHLLRFQRVLRAREGKRSSHPPRILILEVAEERRRLTGVVPLLDHARELQAAWPAVELLTELDFIRSETFNTDYMFHSQKIFSFLLMEELRAAGVYAH